MRQAKKLPRLGFLVLGAWAISVSPLSAEEEEARSSVSILVDLSGTWLNEKSLEQNSRILKVVGQAVAHIGNRTPPTAIRYFPIGDRSFFRDPLCSAVFEPKLIAPKGDNKGAVNNLRSLENYLTVDCVKFILSRPKAPYTDIGSALDTVRRINDRQIAGPKLIIVLSDMKEELRQKQERVNPDLKGHVILLLYRVLEEDRITPKGLDRRLDEWRTRLTANGAKVQDLPDHLASSTQIERLLNQ